jgi:membrane protease YdiL (CAAX protease family)
MKTNKFENIFVHVFFWICCIVLPVLFINPAENGLNYFGKWTLDILFAAAYFYLNIYWIVPELLEKKRIKLYVFVSLLVCMNLIIQQYVTERVFNEMIFDNSNVSMLIIGRGLVSFMWIYAMSNGFVYMKYVKKNEIVNQVGIQGIHYKKPGEEIPVRKMDNIAE